MSDSIGSISLNAYSKYPPSETAGNGGGFGGTDYDAWNNAVIASTGSGSGATSNTADSPPVPPGNVSDPKTGRETPDAAIAFQTVDGQTAATGTAQQLLAQLSALLRLNDSRAKSVTLLGSSMPTLRLPGGYPMQFANTADLQNYLTRSAQPVVPAAAVVPATAAAAAATFQSVLGRASSDGGVAAAENTFNGNRGRFPGN